MSGAILHSSNRPSCYGAQLNVAQGNHMMLLTYSLLAAFGFVCPVLLVSR
jgi:hypothetical protein